MECVIGISITASGYTIIYSRGQFSCSYTCSNVPHQSVVSYNVRAEQSGGGGALDAG